MDRLDYTKGLSEKFLGSKIFLNKYPKWTEKIVLVQIAILSRKDIKE